MSRIAYLGDKYTHTYAAVQMFASDKDVTAGYHTIYAAINSVSECESDYAVAPVENSCGGSIADTLDALWALPLYIRGETVLPVPQHLIGLKGARRDGIRTVYSHPQALSQCASYLRTYFADADVIATASTADALCQLKDFSEAAIARAPAEGQEIIDAEIEDVKNNSTRFLLLGREPLAADQGGKCSVVFETQNRPGALMNALSLFSEHRLNMTRIESRPHKSKLGRYVFFVDFERGNDCSLSLVLGELSQRTTAMKFLGSYPYIKK